MDNTYDMIDYKKAVGFIAIMTYYFYMCVIHSDKIVKALEIIF